MDDGGDEIEVCQNIGPHELVESIKSKAVVKFSAVQVPVKFNRLECNTNLNLPPSNWLTTSDSSYGLHQALYQSSGFASFRMAHMFPDCVGEVDVVSDAENIKRLLKLPYTSKSAVSMIVHKVGNTLLLDEFDIQKYLLRKADDDWKWLRTFILENILAYGEKNRNFCLKDKSREAIQTKNLLSKFLYHSLKQTADNKKSPSQQSYVSNRPLPIVGPVLPEPKIDENMPDPKSSHVFNRNVVWTFEDIRMLIGTDMPIFGGPNRPCISLRLRDMAKPINVLTGIDYWLDNLMCNVPEVVMCYHLDGIVQKYEIIKTEDLPYLEDSSFSPQIVRNVAQNILAFLKANATKSGHTYWLFKGRNDDVVKLYDLTTLCNNQTNCDQKHENPFTVPVAMLLYSVARNMKNSSLKVSPKTAGSIRSLLDSCIKLLPKEKYPQIVTSSHYILSDLHIPSGIDPKNPKFDLSDVDSDTQSVYEEDEDDDVDDNFDFNTMDMGDADCLDDSNENVAVKNIRDTLKEFQTLHNVKRTRPPSPLLASVDERCRIALEHISEGISCLQFFNANEEEFIKESESRAKDEEKQRIIHDELHPNMAKPFKPIPLPYETLHHRQEDLEDPEKSGTALANITSGQNKSIPLSSSNRKKHKIKKNHSKDENCSDQSPDAIAATCESTHKQITTNFNSQLFGSWNVHLKLLLLEKACLSYATLAEHNYVSQKFGSCLKAIYMSFRCQQVLKKYMISIVSQGSCLLGRAGDCFFQMVKNWDSIDDYLHQYAGENLIDSNIYVEIEKDLCNNDNNLVDPIKNVEHLMVASCKCYETALECVGESIDEDAPKELLRRLGNVRNELGVKYMYWAQEEYTKTTAVSPNANDHPKEIFQSDSTTKSSRPSEEPLYMTLAKKSFDSLTRGIQAFTEVEENVNLALLYCNMGRFMRFRAHLHLPDDNNDAVKNQKIFYNEAFSNYERAKDVLGSRKSNPELWDLVNWELSTATFTLTKQLQDFSITSTEQATSDIEKEVMDLLQKSLKLCDVAHPGSRQILYTYRSGLIHKRIASFHYSQLRANFTDIASLSKNTLQLCKYHYERAASVLDSLKEASDYLVVQLERISLQEFLAESSNNNNQKIKHMQHAFEICLQTKSAFEYATSHSVDSSQSITEELHRHMLLFESRLQFALKTLIKLYLNGKDPKKLADHYKQLYMETLKAKKAVATEDNLPLHIQSMLESLLKLNESAEQF